MTSDKYSQQGSLEEAVAALQHDIISGHISTIRNLD